MWLDTRDLAAVQQSMLLIKTHILRLYEPQRSDVRISGTTRSRLVTAHEPVVLSLEGIYMDSGKDVSLGKNAGLGILHTLRQHMTAWRFSWFWFGIMRSGAILVAGD